MIRDTILLGRLGANWHRMAQQSLGWAPVTAEQALAQVRDEGDPWLTRLIDAAQGGDQLAGQVVVMSVLQLLLRISRRDHRLPLETLLAALWVRIQSYPLQRRPAHVVANLVLDARKDVLAEQRPLRPLTRASPSAVLQVRRLLIDAVALGIISDPVRQAMDAMYVEGLSSAEAADALGLSATAVRWRCSSGVRRLATQRDLLAA
ncbi:MAG: hypothetical protein Q4G45_06090 [Actinomycetia bacterium]|nr:hypothetical protein [Actinomycetes bacterium]